MAETNEGLSAGQAIAPLEELARKWRGVERREDKIPGTASLDGEDCADELSSLLPALASRFEALEAEIAALKGNISGQEEEIDRLRKPMSCGHPWACWTEGVHVPHVGCDRLATNKAKVGEGKS